MINNATSGTYVPPNQNALTDIRKYTASSFYNWEQDNIPIEDLETRTNALADNMGLNSSSVTGARLTLSSTENVLDGTFSSLSSIVDRIPQNLTYPLVVQIGTYGDLGHLNLEGITTRGDGKLEFVNLNHAYALAGDPYPSLVNEVEKGDGYSWDISGGDTSILGFTSRQLMDYITSNPTYNKASWDQSVRAFGTQHLSTSGMFQEPFFFVSGANAFIDNAGAYKFKGNVYDNFYDVTVSADANPFEFNHSSQEPMRSNTHYVTKPVAAGTGGSEISPVYAYGNAFQSVTIKNCKGSHIRFRGICVDTSSGDNVQSSGINHSNSIGFDIRNSKVILTSCASFRNNKSGFRINDSDISIEGGITGYRNYSPGPGFENRHELWSSGTDDSFMLDASGNGFEAYNSVIKFDTDSSLLNASGTSNLGKHGFTIASNGGHGWVLENCKISGGVGGHNAIQEQGAGNEDFQTTQLVSAFNKGSGFKIDTSKMRYFGILRSQGNVLNGIDILNSRVGVMGSMAEINGGVGLNIYASDFTYNIGASKYFSGYDHTIGGWENRAGHSQNTPAICSSWNATQNIKVSNNSSFSDNLIDNSGRRAGLVGGRVGSSTYRAMAAMNSKSKSTALVATDLGNLPLIDVDNNSYARILGLSVLGDTANKSILSDLSSTVEINCLSAPIKGRAVSVTNNSKVDLYGTSAFRTVISTYANQETPQTLTSSWLKSALYAGQNSSLRISGPTKIANYGVAALAEDNSTVSIGPALSKGDHFDESLDPLDPSGHSQVELQATRACLVANNNSTIEMARCGAESTGHTINQYDVSSSSYAKHSGSFIQFYPHAFTQELLSNTGGKSDGMLYKNTLNASGSTNRTSRGMGAAGVHTNHNLVSTGGMCVRAIGGSNVIADQVNFEVRMPAKDLSGAYYNLEGSGNEGISVYSGSGAIAPASDTIGNSTNHYAGSKIFMWNVADTSRILASNLTVNTVDPSSAGFHGPAGRWGWTDQMSTSLGPLDYYGETGAFNTVIGGTGHSNHGPFRLMVGVNSDLMSYGETIDEDYSGGTGIEYGGTLSLGGTAIFQLNSQGYAAPGLMAKSVPGSDFRGHTDIETAQGHFTVSGQPIFGARGTDTSSVTGGGANPRYLLSNPMISGYGVSSGFNHLQAFPNFPIPPIHMEWQGYLRNFLDESAAETFANAKHGANKMVKLCSIFRSHTGYTSGGEGRDGFGNDCTYGLGVRSLNMFDMFKQI